MESDMQESLSTGRSRGMNERRSRKLLMNECWLIYTLYVLQGTATRQIEIVCQWERPHPAVNIQPECWSCLSLFLRVYFISRGQTNVHHNNLGKSIIMQELFILSLQVITSRLPRLADKNFHVCKNIYVGKISFVFFFCSCAAELSQINV